MFSSKGKTPTLASDWTNSLREVNFYKIAHLRSFGPLGEITCTAVDPVLSLLAVGTSTGLIHLTGSPAFQCTFFLSSKRELPSPSVKFLTFHPGANRLIAVDEKDTLHTWFLGPGGMDDSKGLPGKEVTVSLFGNVTFIDTPSPSHSHLFLTLKDGNILTFDLSRRLLSPYRIPNAWSAHEERLRRSGVVRLRNLQTPVAVCCAMSPRDLDCMLIGYEGGVVAWKMSTGEAVNTYTMVLPPGSPGGSSYHDPVIWSERTPAVTCLTWRPDGLCFSVGYDDGCFAIWAYDDPDKPLMVRTLKQEDVNVTDAESLLAAGALDSQVRRKEDREAVKDESNTREPIFKLVWASFPDQAGMTALVAAQGAETSGEPLTKATVDYAEKEETLLVVLGGCKPKELPAIHLLQFSAYKPPAPTVKGAMPKTSEGLSHAERVAFRESLNVTGMTTYPTATPAEDFSLLPRSSPYFGLAHDPIAIVITLTPDPSLPPTEGPRASRGIEVYTFPPPRSDVPPEEQGRKDYPSPLFDKEMLGAVPMTPAPSSPGFLTVGTPASASSWRLPWSSAPASPNIASIFGSRHTKAKPARPLRLPSLFWNGGMTMLGVQVHSLSNFAFKRLIAWSIEKQGMEDKPRLPIRGGVAVPDLVSPNAPDPKAIKMEAYRVMATWSVDGAVRFWDISPHILVLPPSQLRFEYPAPLPHLTISITNILKHPSVAHLPIAKLLRDHPSRVRITGVDLAADSLECAISMSTGEVFVYKFGEAVDGPDVEGEWKPQEEETSPKDEYFPVSVEGMGFTAPDDVVLVDEITPLNHLASRKADGFRPICLLITRRGPVITTALSDIGFLAVAYANKSLAVLDLRGPEVILREGFNEEGMKVKRRRKGSQNLPGESQHVRTIKWTISRLGSDPVTAPRLIVSYARGLNKIFTLSQVLGEWVVDPKALSFSHDQLANPLASYVMNLEGDEIVASSDSLAYAIRSATNDSHLPQDKNPHCVWIACSGRSIRASVNYSGERMGKVELGPEEELVQAFLVQKNGNKVLVGVARNGVGHAYSLPALDPIAGFNMRLFPDKPLGRIAMDPKSGDYIEYLSPLEIHLRTLFFYRKPLLPRIDPHSVKRPISAQPVPLASSWGISSWIWGGAPLTGAQLDALLAGPNRPPVPKPQGIVKPAQPLITWGAVPDSAPKPMPARVGPRKAQAQAEPAKYDRVDVYTEMTNAAAERGLTLDNLNQQMENVVVGAGEMLKSARNVAAKEGAKASARSLFKF